MFLVVCLDCMQPVSYTHLLGREALPFTKGEDGIWTLTIGPLKPDMYAYHFNVDGVQIADPGNTYAADVYKRQDYLFLAFIALFNQPGATGPGSGTRALGTLERLFTRP